MIETTWSELYILQILVYTRQVCPSRPLIVAHASKYQSKFDDEQLTVSVLLGRWSVQPNTVYWLGLWITVLSCKLHTCIR